MKDISVILGIGKPKQKRESMPVPRFGSASKEASADEPSEKYTKPLSLSAPEQEESESAGIPPEAVCFRSAEEVCGNCEHLAQDGECSRLKTPVGPGDSCNLFQATEQGAFDIEQEEPAING